MLLITLGFISLTLMICSYIFKRPALSVSGAVLWLLFGLWSLSLSTGIWDIYYDLFVVGIGLFIAGLFETMALRPKPEKNESTMTDYWDVAKADYLKRKAEQSNKSNRG